MVTDPVPLRQTIDQVLARMGLGGVELFEQLRSEWPQLAGDVWHPVARPVLVHNGELLVEATPAAVGLLRYGTGELLRRLDARFGPGVIESVRVKNTLRPGLLDQEGAWG